MGQQSELLLVAGFFCGNTIVDGNPLNFERAAAGILLINQHKIGRNMPHVDFAHNRFLAHGRELLSGSGFNSRPTGGVLTNPKLRPYSTASTSPFR